MWWQKPMTWWRMCRQYIIQSTMSTPPYLQQTKAFSVVCVICHLGTAPVKWHGDENSLGECHNAFFCMESTWNMKTSKSLLYTLNHLCQRSHDSCNGPVALNKLGLYCPNFSAWSFPTGVCGVWTCGNMSYRSKWSKRQDIRKHLYRKTWKSSNPEKTVEIKANSEETKYIYIYTYYAPLELSIPGFITSWSLSTTLVVYPARGSSLIERLQRREIELLPTMELEWQTRGRHFFFSWR